MSLLDTALSIFAPYDCIHCGTEGRLLCNACLAHLPAPMPTRSIGCIATVASATTYTGIAKELIWHIKSSGTQSASHIMAACMLQYVPTGAILTPVPTATSRMRSRGYDQARLIARALARQSGQSLGTFLIRQGQTHQVGATRSQRLAQLQLAFRVKHAMAVRGAHIVLIDDVTTTGASLERAAEALMAAGARRVDAVTFAYTPPS